MDLHLYVTSRLACKSTCQIILYLSFLQVNNESSGATNTSKILWKKCWLPVVSNETPQTPLDVQTPLGSYLEKGGEQLQVMSNKLVADVILLYIHKTTYTNIFFL